MEGRGTLTIAVDGTALAAEEIDRCAAGDYVRIAVSDTGCGMTPEVLERVFEPFFTTQPVGKGTGLGLSQIFGFQRQADGEIAIASTPRWRTTVTDYLPLHLGKADLHPVRAHSGPTARPVVGGDVGARTGTYPVQ